MITPFFNAANYATFSLCTSKMVNEIKISLKLRYKANILQKTLRSFKAFMWNISHSSRRMFIMFTTVTTFIRIICVRIAEINEKLNQNTHADIIL